MEAAELCSELLGQRSILKLCKGSFKGPLKNKFKKPIAHSILRCSGGMNVQKELWIWEHTELKELSKSWDARFSPGKRYISQILNPFLSHKMNCPGA